MSRIFWEFSLRALSDFNQANNLNILMKKLKENVGCRGIFSKLKCKLLNLRTGI